MAAANPTDLRKQPAKQIDFFTAFPYTLHHMYSRAAALQYAHGCRGAAAVTCGRPVCTGGFDGGDYRHQFGRQC
jgi:hypothetical protein